MTPVRVTGLITYDDDHYYVITPIRRLEAREMITGSHKAHTHEVRGRRVVHLLLQRGRGDEDDHTRVGGT